MVLVPISLLSLGRLSTPARNLRLRCSFLNLLIFNHFSLLPRILSSHNTRWLHIRQSYFNMPPKKKPVQKDVKDSEQVAAEAALVSLENKDAPTGDKNKEIDDPTVEDVPKTLKKAPMKKQKKLIDIPQPTPKGSEGDEKQFSDAAIASGDRNGEVDSPVEEVLKKPVRKAKNQKKPVNEPKASKDGLEDEPGVNTVEDAVQKEVDKENVEGLKPDDKPAKKTEKSSPRRGAKRGPNKADAAPSKSAEDASDDKEVADCESVDQTVKTDEEPVKKTEKAPPRRGARRGVQKVDDAPSIPSSRDLSEDKRAEVSPAESVSNQTDSADKPDEEPLKKKEKLTSRRGAKRGQKAEDAPPNAASVDTCDEAAETQSVEEEADKENTESLSTEGGSKDVEKASSRLGVKRGPQNPEDASSDPVSNPRRGGRKDVQVAKEVRPEHEDGGDDASNESGETLQEGKGAGKKRGGKAKEDKGGQKNETEPDEKKAKMEEETNYECEKLNKKGEKWNLKISTWNVAGIRAWVKKSGVNYLREEDADIICLQETKCNESKIPPEAKVEGYHTFWASGVKEGYAGVALYSKEKPLNVTYGIDNKEHDKEGRVITAEYEKFYLVTTYVPNAGQGLKTLPKRMEWDALFKKYLKDLDAKKPVILCGDLNVAHEEIDLANPKTNTKHAGFTKEERENMSALLKEGFVDSFRQLYPDKTGCYTFWTYLGNARSRNTGWRLDYFILSEPLMDSVCDVVIRDKVLGSDHCPTTLFIHI